MNSLGKGCNPLQSHSDFGPKKPVPSTGRHSPVTNGPKKTGRSAIGLEFPSCPADYSHATGYPFVEHALVSNQQVQIADVDQ